MAGDLPEKTPEMTSGTPDSHSDTGSPAEIEKEDTYHVEAIESKAERGHGALRIDGDDLDHEHEPKVVSFCTGMPPY